jgi:hypothetical protein
VTELRHIDAAEMERVLRAGSDRCCYCQERDYTPDNPMVNVIPPHSALPKLVAHAKCDEPVQAWRRMRK